MSIIKFSDLFADKLLEFGYSHCYFVAGGNIMHLLNSVRSRFICIPFAHEVGAAIATEYHNASISGLQGRAFCLVTAGPGLTNAVTGVAGAWQESRDLLIVGGQVKTSDLAGPGLRQRGIQEVDGVELLRSITKAALRIDSSAQLDEALEALRLGNTPRKGPVFLELPLDVQGGGCGRGGGADVGRSACLPANRLDRQRNVLLRSPPASPRPQGRCCLSAVV